MGWKCGFALPNKLGVVEQLVHSRRQTRVGRRGAAAGMLEPARQGMATCQPATLAMPLSSSRYFARSPVPQPTPLMLFSLGSCTLPRSGLPPLSITSGPLNSARMWRRRVGGPADTCASKGVAVGAGKAGGFDQAGVQCIGASVSSSAASNDRQASTASSPLTTSDGWSMTTRVRMRCRPEVARIAGETVRLSVHLQVGGVVAGSTDA